MVNKTQKNDCSVIDYIQSVEVKYHQDCQELLDIMQNITGVAPVMWGSSIVGFGEYHYKYASGREGDWLLTGFSARKQSLTIYIMNGFVQYDSFLSQLGNHKLGKSCLYIKSLSDIDTSVLSRLINQSVNDMKNMYPTTLK